MNIALSTSVPFTATAETQACSTMLSAAKLTSRSAASEVKLLNEYTLADRPRPALRYTVIGQNRTRWRPAPGSLKFTGRSPPMLEYLISRGAIGTWSVNLRERSLGAETVSGLGVQTIGSPEYITGTNASRLTAVARCTLRGTPHTHTHAELDTTERGSKEH
ncbi:hypothetical protein EVAR_23706_1 [Eumeta japonica]|uniref:Uncharacterized protein n=1 Tax=Eumeta variegata TaxID=151549 RepID=A0A4C1VEW5_EUMVA|nr:hypothetical protein EVAR_23706_1 [Eumeta japonica]